MAGHGVEALQDVDAEVVHEADELMGWRRRVGGCVQEDGTVGDREQEPVGRIDVERRDQGGDVRGLRCDEQ